MKRLVFVLLLAGCAGGQLDPRTQRALRVFECRVNVIAPYVGDVCDAADLVRDAARGEVDLGRFLTTLGHTREAIEAVNAAWGACVPPVAPAEARARLAFRELPEDY